MFRMFIVVQLAATCLLSSRAEASTVFSARGVTVQEGARPLVSLNGKEDTIYLDNVHCRGLKQPYRLRANRVTEFYAGGWDVRIRSYRRDEQNRSGEFSGNRVDAVTVSVDTPRNCKDDGGLRASLQNLSAMKPGSNLGLHDSCKGAMTQW